MAWLQIVVQTSGDQVDTVSEAFNSMGALSVTVLDGGDEPLLEPAPGETPLWQNIQMMVLFDAKIDTSAVLSQWKNDSHSEYTLNEKFDKAYKKEHK